MSYNFLIVKILRTFLLLVSRKKFVCQHSSFSKVSSEVSREENKKGNSKNANCLASVTCMVKLDTHSSHSTRKVNPFIRVWTEHDQS